MLLRVYYGQKINLLYFSFNEQINSGSYYQNSLNSPKFQISEFSKDSLHQAEEFFTSNVANR